MFYEFNHSIFDDYYNIQSNENFSFPHHMHQSFEIIAVSEGSMTVSVGEKKKTISKNEIAIIFPNQVHSLQTENNSRHTLCIFSDKFVRKFSKKHTGIIPNNNFITLPPYLAESFCSLNQDANICTVSGVLYMILGLFDSQTTYSPAESVHSEDLFYKIFSYISSRDNCSMQDLSKHTGYNYMYLSKLFKKVAGIPFKQYINEHKISKACHLLSTTDKSIIEISEECGYNSLRSFNRNFMSVTNLSPSHYRKKGTK